MRPAARRFSAIQVARLVGATPIAATRTRGKKEALLKAGAEHVIVTQEENLVARTAEFTANRGARVAFDPVAGPLLQLLVGAMAPGGIIIEYGVLSPESTLLPLFPLLVKGLTLYGYQYKQTVRDAERRDRAKRFILEGLASGALKPVIDRVFPFEQIAERCCRLINPKADGLEGLVRERQGESAPALRDTGNRSGVLDHTYGSIMARWPSRDNAGRCT